MTPFEIRDCALLIRTSGLLPAVNLRELRERLAACSTNVIYHHFCETPMAPSFDNPDYRNDFAVWCKLHLGDRVLAERLGILDPYRFSNMEELRGAILDLMDERLSELPLAPSAPPGSEFHFMEATTVVFDTGRRINDPGAMAAAVRGMTTSSIFFHYLEARRRNPEGVDDFSAWLANDGDSSAPVIDSLQGIDFTFYTMAELREVLADTLSPLGGGQ